MSKVEVTITRQNSDLPPISVHYDFGDDLKELVGKFGDEVAFIHAKRSLINALKGNVGAVIDKGLDRGWNYERIVEEILDSVSRWKPSKRRASMSDREKVEHILSKLPPAERITVLREYEARLRSEASAAE